MKKLVKGWEHDLGAARILRQKGHSGGASQLEGLADWKAKKIQEQYLNLKALGKI